MKNFTKGMAFIEIMKQLVKGLLCAGMITVFGCVTVRHTQEQVFAMYRTKPDVVNKFGIATEKIVSDTLEQWLYKYEDKMGAHRSYTQSANTSTGTVAEFSKFKRYITFNFDKQGKVIKWSTYGVDLTDKKLSPGKTIALVAILVGAFAVLLVIIGHNSSVPYPY